MGNLASRDDNSCAHPQSQPASYGTYYKNVYPDGSYNEGYIKFFTIIASKHYNQDGILIDEYNLHLKLRRSYYPSGQLKDETIDGQTIKYRLDGHVYEKINGNVKTVYNIDGSCTEEERLQGSGLRIRDRDVNGKIIAERVYDSQGRIQQIFSNNVVIYDYSMVRDLTNDYLNNFSTKDLTRSISSSRT